MEEGKTPDMGPQLPFKMDELLNFSYGFEQLKAAIEYLMNKSFEHEKKMG